MINSQVDHCRKDNMMDTSIIPKLIVFFSQFVLGIGTTLYYGLGQPYMDDNSKKKNMPMLFGLTFALRTVGPAIGFIFSYFFMNLYIDPSLHPIIDKNDPRWLGAWWLGWIALAFMQGLFALLVSLFLSELRKSRSKNNKATLNKSKVSLKNEVPNYDSIQEKPTLKEFPATIKRLVMNKLLIINTFSCVFYVLSTAPFMSFFAKYLEVQFNTSSAGGTIISGPLTLMEMVLGFLISGFAISKFKPSPRPLISWNILVGLSFAIGQIIIMFVSCDKNGIQGVNLDTMKLNLTTSCSKACNCDQVKFSPVCHELSGTTFFSACHASCQTIINDTVFGDCSCVFNLNAVAKNAYLPNAFSVRGGQSLNIFKNSVIAGPCKQNCFKPYMIYSIVSTVINILVCSGRIGNVLINYRCVETRDKGLAQGIGLMAVSLIAFIPGPIIYGAIMDSTCLIWDHSCENIGNCWVYDKDKFRYYVNTANAVFCVIGVFLDMLVCYYSKNLDLYGEEEGFENWRLSELKSNKKLRNRGDSYHN